MFRLIIFEFRKLFRNLGFYICSLVLIGLSIFTVYSAKFYQEQSGIDDPTMCGLKSLMEALPTSMIVVMLGIFIAMLTCEDYTLGTVRNILTRGYSRLGFYLSKFVAVIFATVFMSVLCCAVSYATGCYFWEAGDAIEAEQIKNLLCQLCIMIAYGAIFYSISTVLQKTGGSIAVCVVLPMILTIVLRLGDTALAEKEIEISSYWLENIGAALGVISAEAEDMKKALAASGIYTAAFLALGWLLTMKREY